MANTISLFGMKIDRVSMEEAAARVLDWCATGREGICRYVVTPNVDHAVMFQHRSDLRDAYRHASLVLADGAPLVWVARMLGKSMPERVAGSDLVPRLFADATARCGGPSATNDTARLRVFLLGAAPGVADRAAARIGRDWPGVKVVGTCSPTLGFEHDDAENERIIAKIARHQPDLLVVGLGAPKQELWVARHHERLATKVALCVGATIDFLAGAQRRSPVWMRHIGLEWLYRMLSNPRRLAARYARDAWHFPQLIWREMRGQSS